MKWPMALKKKDFIENNGAWFLLSNLLNNWYFSGAPFFSIFYRNFSLIFLLKNSMRNCVKSGLALRG